MPEHLNAIHLRLLENNPATGTHPRTTCCRCCEHLPDSLDVERWPQGLWGVAHKATLEHLIDQLHHHAAGHALLIKGTTGQGKTSLLDTGVEIAKTHGIAVARGRAPQGGGTFSLFEQVYRTLPAREGDALLGEVFDKGVLPVDRYAFYAAFHELLRTNGSLLLILDDLQFGDAPSIEFLLYLVHNALHLGDDPFTLILSYTIGSVPLHADIENSRMGPRAATAHRTGGRGTVLTLLVDDDDSRRLATWLHEESGGAPAQG